LPDNQQDVGRPTKYAAEAYLAKVKLYQAYVQDKANNVVSINKSDLQQVVKLTSDVINSGKYGLLNNFGGDFMFKNDNTKFSVWAVQRSINDGTPNGRVDMGNALNYPMNPSYGCCWFHIPSQNLVNAFKTNKNGLPEFSTYNNSSIKDSVDFQNQTVDPRLDYTVGIPTHPWKDDPNFVYEKSWARTPDVYGYYSSMKEAQLPSCSCLKKVGPFYADSKNTVIIRYADVLLWKAEALIQLGRQNEALPLINKVREQAKNSKGSLKYSNGKPISDYHIETYKPGVNCTWTKDYALKALHWEDRLEFAMEGKRFFNLVRWGIADSVMNNYFNTEKARHQFLSNGHFQKNKDEYLPIPQNQINFSHGLYKQNYGWK
ncbi:MAG TPA: RagB/SusD family nutrient uptake outer membrane protein, partial [Balneolales bacterium]|nr:RagB/SusD family nutrient uptake outer membrane protein [Balneolales bacterium]